MPLLRSRSTLIPINNIISNSRLKMKWGMIAGIITVYRWSAGTYSLRSSSSSSRVLEVQLAVEGNRRSRSLQRRNDSKSRVVKNRMYRSCTNQ